MFKKTQWVSFLILKNSQLAIAFRFKEQNSLISYLRRAKKYKISKGAIQQSVELLKIFCIKSNRFW
jgi:hypothetical protein